MTLDLTLLTPGLFGIRAENLYRDLDLRPLELVLSRATPCKDRFAADCLEGMLCRAVGIDPGAESDWPVAALSRALDEGSVRDTWHLRADPVHARAGLGEVTLLHPHELTISPPEATILTNAINTHFADEPWRIQALHPHRWYIECPTAPGVTTVALSRVTGSVVSELLPQGEQATYWRSVLNEIQMLLHTHPLNEKRSSERTLPVNSIWLWGIGKPPLLAHSGWDLLCSDHHLGESIAESAGIKHARLADGLSELLRQGAALNRALVVIDWLDLTNRRSDFEGWREGIQRVIEDWFVPLVGALRCGALGSVEISLGDGSAYHLKRSHIKHWWRRRRTFAVLSGV